MKKVRFQSPNKRVYSRMEESECHSPRPFMENRAPTQAPDIFEYKKVYYTDDPIQRFENSDCSPYPVAKKTVVPLRNEVAYNYLPSNDLNLSMLDCHEPRQFYKSNFKSMGPAALEINQGTCSQANILSQVENLPPPNVLNKDNSFFIRKDTFDKYRMDVNPLQNQLNKLQLGKENYPLVEKLNVHSAKVPRTEMQVPTFPGPPVVVQTAESSNCRCHHCYKVAPNNNTCNIQPSPKQFCGNDRSNSDLPLLSGCNCQTQVITCLHCEHHIQNVPKTCQHTEPVPPSPLRKNAVDKKTWLIEKYEQNKKSECTEIEKQMNVSKEKREPTIADLLKIIKLQNEQLQLLQDKVDKFITVSTNQPQIQSVPIQNYITEQVALQTVDSEHKISIGVMTSFEMVRTSTVINKEVLKKTNDNAQIQCNRSQISIKEVVSKKPVNLNFLDGITRVSRSPQADIKLDESAQEFDNTLGNNTAAQTVNNEKTLNELSLYDVQVDNATTPQLSPEQTMYLDVRDYSDSDSTSSDDHSNVGWTYYNKVLTHVNGMLEDSDMPSSASALYRNTRQQCVQMQIDKTNVSVTKRVKFGDDPLGIHQPHIYGASTDTSLKMNQLAAKYLHTTSIPQRVLKPITTPIDMSFATRNYMERHKLIQGQNQAVTKEMSRFLDITALKQQPKFL